MGSIAYFDKHSVWIKVCEIAYAKSDEIWNKKIPQQQVIHLVCLNAHNAFGFSHTLWPFIHCEEHRGQAFTEGGGNFHHKVNSIIDSQNRPFF